MFVTAHNRCYRGLPRQDIRHAGDPPFPIFSENVIATPHIGGVTDVSYEGIARAFAGNVKRYAAGERPLYLANDPTTIRRRVV